MGQPREFDGEDNGMNVAKRILMASVAVAAMAAGSTAFAGGFVMTLFEGFVQFLQAYVFTLLTALYIAGSLATADEH